MRVPGLGDAWSRKQQTKSTAYVREVIGVGVAAVWLFLFFALYSYQQSDPSWCSFSSVAGPVHNWCGPWGASCAGLFMYLFGVSAYVMMAWIALVAYTVWSGAWRVHAVRSVAGAVLWLLASVWGAALAATPVHAGGLLGYALFGYGVARIGLVGSWLLLVAATCMVSAVLVRQQVVTLFWSGLCSGVVAVCALGAGVWHRVRSTLLFVGQFFDACSMGYVMIVRSRLGVPVKGQHTFHQQDRLVERTAGQDIKRNSVDRVRATTIPRMVLGAACVRLPTTCLSLYLFVDQARSWYALRTAVGTASRQKANPLPDVRLFGGQQQVDTQLQDVAQQGARALEHKLLQFGVRGRVTAVKPGPVITLYEYAPDPDTKVSKIVALEDDLALALSARSIRIIAPVPGTSVVGFEIAHQHRSAVHAATLFASKTFSDARTHMRMPLALGVDVSGLPAIYDLATMPHLLVGGSTGSGKSVGLHSMLVSLLCARSPEQLRMILIDPKRLEFTAYQDVPHLLVPVITVPAQVGSVLKWVVYEMEQRYQRMAATGARNIEQYQQLAARDSTGQHPAMPFMVVVIDELADLMMVAGKEIEAYIVRIAQMARAAGIHMILATQRPSVDVVTGLIKVNFPSRVAFKVSSKIDSRTILDASGAEKLLGKGDMLFLHNSGQLLRLHGAYVAEDQVLQVIAFWKDRQAPQYLDLSTAMGTMTGGAVTDFDQQDEELYKEVLAFVRQSDQVSISLLQRKFRIGFNKSARMIERLESDGLISPVQAGKVRKVLR